MLQGLYHLEYMLKLSFFNLLVLSTSIVFETGLLQLLTKVSCKSCAVKTDLDEMKYRMASMYLPFTLAFQTLVSHFQFC